MSPALFFFGAFWLAQVLVLIRGMESIRAVEKYSAPVLIFLCAALLAWALSAAGGFGPMLSQPSAFGPGMPKAGKFLATFVPAVTAQVGRGSTLDAADTIEVASDYDGDVSISAYGGSAAAGSGSARCKRHDSRSCHAAHPRGKADLGGPHRWGGDEV